MIEDLKSTLSSVDFEDYGTLLLKNAEWFEETKELKLYLNVKIDEQSNFPSDWKVTAVKVRTHKITLGYADNFDLITNHVLSWEHSKPLCSLSFRGKTNTVPAVIGELCQAHREIAGNWIPFDRYFNQMKLNDLISGGFGQLIYDAPSEIADVYENVMREYNFQTSRSKTRLPLYWNGEQMTSITVPPLTMIFDDSYIVAEHFEANPI